MNIFQKLTDIGYKLSNFTAYSIEEFDNMKISDNSRVVETNLVVKWFREELGILIVPNFKPNIKKWDYICYDANLNGFEYINYYKVFYNREGQKEIQLDSFEEAQTKGIEYCLLHLNLNFLTSKDGLNYEKLNW